MQPHRPWKKWNLHVVASRFFSLAKSLYNQGSGPAIPVTCTDYRVQLIQARNRYDSMSQPSQLTR
jgi:hypothetical protein